MTTTTEADFLKAIEANPVDWNLRLVYADFLEELGDSIGARGQRWQAEHRKTSKDSSAPKSHYWYDQAKYSGKNPGWYESEEDELDEELFNELQGYVYCFNVGCKTFADFAAAERSLAEALWRLKR